MHFKFEQALRSDSNRLQSLRLAALKDAPYAYGAKYEVEKDKPIQEWQHMLETSNWFFVSSAGEDIGLIGVEKAGADRLSDCWIFGWWIAQPYRGKGVVNFMLEEIDKFCLKKHWLHQGLGVWPENKRAVAAYKKLGFVAGKELIPSRSIPDQMYQPMYRFLSQK
ncbi:MAG: GNAT family N-acetyltransferase [Candidatus Nanopelagicus sp.]